jgi:predicted  nucleic acid-binding Zn-ribbon protein
MSDQDFIKGLENLHHMVCGPPEPERDEKDYGLDQEHAIDRISELEMEIERLQAELTLAKAEAEGAASLLLDVQNDCIVASKKLAAAEKVVEAAQAVRYQHREDGRTFIRELYRMFEALDAAKEGDDE